MSKGFKRKRDLDRYGIPSLYIGIPICVIVGYIFLILSPQLYEKLCLIPYNVVIKHEYWRLFTWIFTVPYGMDLLTFILLPIMLYFYYSIGKSLEQLWGRFMFNLYIFGTIILTDILVLIGALYYYRWGPMALSNTVDFTYNWTDLIQTNSDSIYAGLHITHYFLISIFLAFTVIGGDSMVYLYFIIPLKMKWLGYIDLIYMVYLFITGGFFSRLIIIGMLANYFIYAFLNRKKTAPSFADLKRRAKFNNAMKRRPKNTYNEDGTIQFRGNSRVTYSHDTAQQANAIHRCAVCGITELDSPNMEFRFCSKCEGNYEYCKEHLYTHQHVRS